MVEKIIQGGETAEKIATRRATWQMRDQDLANTPLQFEDVERLIRTQFTPDIIAAAKRDRGKPMP